MEIVRLTLGPYQTNTYIIKQGDFCAVIDPEMDGGETVAALNARGWTLTDILITHAHLDHVRGVNDLPPAALHIHELDAPYLPGTNEDIGMPFAKREPIDRPITPFRDGDAIGPLTAIHLPGHSPGCCAFAAPGHLFSGDAMFVGGIPRLDFILCDKAAYVRSLERIRALDADEILYPGHGPQGKVGEGIP